MKYLIMTMGLCVMPLLFFLFRKSLSFYPSAILTLVSFSSPYLVANATTIMTETPYLLWSSAALLFAFKFAESGSFRILPYLSLLLLLIATVATRILGVSVILAVCLYMTFKIPWRRGIKEGNLFSSYRLALGKILMLVLPTLIALIFWQWRQSQIGLAPWQVLFQAGIGTHTQDNFISLSNVLGQGIFSADTFRWYRLSPEHLLASFNLWWLMFCIIIMTGMIRELAKCSLMAIYTLCMIVLLLLASSTPQERVTLRYISVLMPFLCYHFYLGLAYLTGEVLRTLRIKKLVVITKMLTLMTLIFVLGVNLNGNSYNVCTKSAVYNAWYGSFLKAATWCGENLPADAYIMSIKPRIVYLYSGLKGAFLVNERDSYSKRYEQEKLDLIRSSGITHIIVDAISNATKNNFYPILENNPDKFRALTVPGLEGKCTVVEVLDW